MTLENYGWNSTFQEEFDKLNAGDLIPARIAIHNKNNYLIYAESGEITSELSGKMLYEIEDGISDEGFPVVGDWVAVRAFPDENKAIIQKMLPRKSKFSRKEAGEKTKEQIVAANVDTVFLMTSLNQDFNLRRLERYIVLANQSNAHAVIILSKADLCDNYEEIIEEVKTVSKDIPIHIVSSLKAEGLEELQQYFEGNKTITVMGSSGVGKSTFINALLGYDRMKVNETTEYKDKGSHTTTHRELVLLPGGGLIIDTPGMREIQLWESQQGIESAFDEIEALMENCKFSDCSHTNEPGCAILEALKSGELDSDRYNSYLKLKRESQYFERRHNKKLQIDERKKWKAITKSMRKHNKYKK